MWGSRTITTSRTASDERAALFLRTIKERGWNAYDSTGQWPIAGDDVIKSGLADKLELDRRYILRPRASDPKDPTQVNEKLEVITESLSRRDPLTISIRGGRHPLIGFILREGQVAVYTPEVNVVRYESFLSALRGIVQVPE